MHTVLRLGLIDLAVL